MVVLPLPHVVVRVLPQEEGMLMDRIRIYFSNGDARDFLGDAEAFREYMSDPVIRIISLELEDIGTAYVKSLRVAYWYVVPKEED